MDNEETKLESYITLKCIESIIFDINDKNIYDNDIYNIKFLKLVKETIDIYARMGYINAECKEKIFRFLMPAREIKDKYRNERFEIVNDIIRILNCISKDESINFYRVEIFKRTGEKDFLNANKLYDEEIELEIDRLGQAMSFEFFMIKSILDNNGDYKFIFEAVPELENNQFFYDAINLFLSEYPELFKNKQFYERIHYVLNKTESNLNDKNISKINKKIKKTIDKSNKKINK